MTSTATVSGGSGTTITVTVNSATSAIYAQDALNQITSLVDLGIIGSFVDYTGAALPPIPSGQYAAVLASGSVSLPAFSMGNGYLDAVINASVPVTFNDGFYFDEVVVAGLGGVVMNNVSQDATIVLGGGANVVNQAFPGASAFITLDGVGLFTDSSGSGNGFTDVNALANSLVVMGNTTGLGGRVVNVFEGPVVVEAPATTTDTSLDINVSKSSVTSGQGSLSYLPDGGKAFIHMNGDTTVYGASADFGTSGLGSETVQASLAFGAPPGRLIVSDGNGYFVGGNSGSNLLVSSTIPGAATLVGGNSGDLVLAQAAGDALQAGAGSETLAGFGPGGDTFVAAQFSTGYVNGGIPTVNSAMMFGAPSGGNTFELSGGFAAIMGGHATSPLLSGAATVAGAATVMGAATVTGGGTTLPGGAATIAGAVTVPGGYAVGTTGGFFAAGSPNQYGEAVFGAAAVGGVDIIGDFVPGLDRYSFVSTTGGPDLTLSSITVYAPSAPGSPFGADTGTDVFLSDGTHVEFFNAALSTSDFH